MVMSMANRTNDEYREYLMNKYKQTDINGFTEEEMIDFLLLTVCPKKDYLKIRENLIEKFGCSFSKIVGAGTEELEKVKGINKQVADFISMLPTVSRVYTSGKKIFRTKLTLKNIGYYAMSLMLHREEELLYVISLNKEGGVISEDMIGKGGLTSVEIDMKVLSKTVIKSGAYSIILIHNHPNGVARASNDDVMMTKMVAEYIKKVDIILIDHIIVNDREFYSMQREYPNIFFN